MNWVCAQPFPRPLLQPSQACQTSDRGPPLAAVVSHPVLSALRVYLFIFKSLFQKF